MLFLPFCACLWRQQQRRHGQLNLCCYIQNHQHNPLYEILTSHYTIALAVETISLIKHIICNVSCGAQGSIIEILPSPNYMYSLFTKHFTVCHIVKMIFIYSTAQSFKLKTLNTSTTCIKQQTSVLTSSIFHVHSCFLFTVIILRQISSAHFVNTMSL